MRAIVRGLTVLIVAAATVIPLSSAASAATATDPCEVADGYAAPATCKVLVEDVTAACTDDLTGANLTYAVTVEGGLQASTVTVKVMDTAGHSSSMTGQPLSGSVAWPKAVTAKDATVTFTTETLTPYAVSTSIKTPACVSAVLAADDPAVTKPGSGGVTQVLAATGAQVGPLLGVAAGLLVAGVVALLVARRRRSVTR
ncbi:MAG: LPXTG cell wall anchor domain-containing protein [Actinobacteria bacterium]|nr:LPXTG cell wall anchor domain-containing protein [Actinomycetota bacterium]MCG2801670.1 LPXTG cell wall anchor domain-containing protein [Cellulomonas sp.]